MGDVIIKTKVPDEKEESFKRLVESIIKHYNKKSNIIDIIDELEGSIKAKSWRRLKHEYYESIHR
jgi:hypothetical protein